MKRKPSTWTIINGHLVRTYPSGKPFNLALLQSKRVKSNIGAQMDRAYSR